MAEQQNTAPPVPTPAAFPPPLPPKKHEDHIMRGIIYALAAYFLLGVMQACAKILTETHSVIEVTFYRNFIALVPLTIYILATQQRHLFKTKKPKAILFRAVLGTISLMVTYLAVKLLPMADATVIFFTGVLITPGIAFFALREYIGPHRWAAIIIGIIGVIIMVRPTGEAYLIGVLVAFCAALIHAITNVSLRYLKTESPLTITYYFVLAGAIIPALFLPFVGKMPEPNELLLFLADGISGGLAQFTLTSAFRMAPASLVTPLNYTGLIWATMFDIMIWHYIPGWPVFAGGAIIIASQAYIIHREKLSEKRQK